MTINARHPLATSISDAFTKFYKKPFKNRNRQADIVSETLCDDIIQYLSPTLEQHKGCTIIDVNPGACLWSSKLHDFLKPKWHLLMEPQEAYFKPFIQPLLDKPGSTYRFTTLPGAHSRSYWSSYRKILDDPTLLPPRPALAEGDANRRKIDPSLLLIGNLKRTDIAAKYTNNVAMAPLILQHMTYAALSNDIFQSSGLIRMLWWMDESRNKSLGYESSFTRAPLTLGMETGAVIHQVAGVTSLYHKAQGPKITNTRPTSMSEQVASRVQGTMQSIGMVAPPDRELLVASPDKDHIDEPIGELQGRNPLKTDCSDFADLLQRADDLQKRVVFVKEHSRKIFNHHSRIDAAGPPPEFIAQIRQSLQYSQCVELCRRSPRYEKMPARTREYKPVLILDLLLRQLNLEANYSALAEKHPDHADKEVARLAVLNADAAVHEMLAQGYKQPVALAEDMFEHMIAFYTTPSVLQHDARQYEPLKIERDAFFPEQEMTLLDVLPREQGFDLRGEVTSKEAAQICKEMLKLLFINSGSPLPKLLNTVAINAGTDIVNMVPALTDARKGGRLNPDRLKPRLLSVPLVRDMVNAFIEWPFRPPTWQMAIAAEDLPETQQETEEDHALSMSA